MECENEILHSPQAVVIFLGNFLQFHEQSKALVIIVKKKYCFFLRGVNWVNKYFESTITQPIPGSYIASFIEGQMWVKFIGKFSHQNSHRKTGYHAQFSHLDSNSINRQRCEQKSSNSKRFIDFWLNLNTSSVRLIAFFWYFSLHFLMKNNTFGTAFLKTETVISDILSRLNTTYQNDSSVVGLFVLLFHKLNIDLILKETSFSSMFLPLFASGFQFSFLSFYFELSTGCELICLVNLTSELSLFVSDKSLLIVNSGLL